MTAHTRLAPPLVESISKALTRNALPGETTGLSKEDERHAAEFLAEVAAQRKRGELALTIESTGGEAGHRRMRIGIVNDDMPFLVDSVANAVAARQLTIHRLLHPVVCVERDDKGGLCEVEDYPGLVQLVSTVRAHLRPGTGWPEIFAATFPPASVSGAPKSSALRIIAELEPLPRGPYCGTVGFIDSDRDEAVLAVTIRTFWLDGDELRFGTGAGITWGSRPEGEWAETQLKAERLVAIASAGETG